MKKDEKILWRLKQKILQFVFSKTLLSIDLSPHRTIYDFSSQLIHILTKQFIDLHQCFLTENKREKKKYALSTQCIGLGQGIATILETVN